MCETSGLLDFMLLLLLKASLAGEIRLFSFSVL